MTSSEIRILFRKPDVAVLEVIASACEGTEVSILRTIASLSMEAHSPYVFRAGDRVMVDATVTEHDGSGLGHLRVGALLGELRRTLSKRSRTRPAAAPSEMPTAA